MTSATRPARRARFAVVVATPAPRRIHKRRASGAAIAVLLGFTVALGLQAALGRVVAADRDALADPLYHDKFTRLQALTESAGRTPDLLFVGSSRTYDAIDAGAAGAMLSRDLGRPVVAFDFATSGTGPVTSALYLRRLLADGARPNAVVLEVHPAFLADVSPPFEERWLRPLRLRPGERNLVRNLGLSVEGEPGGLLRAGYEHRVHLLERFAPALSPLPYRLASGAETDAYGFVRVPDDLSARQRERMRDWTRSQYSRCWADYRPGGSGLLGLRDALETCRAAGVRAALLITPESGEFRSWYGPGYSQIAPAVDGLAHEFGVPLFDAREWLPDALIADGHHLTGAGADALTARLVRDAVGPWLRTGGQP